MKGSNMSCKHEPTVSALTNRNLTPKKGRRPLKVSAFRAEHLVPMASQLRLQED